MNSLGSFHRRWRLEVAFVLVPFAALIVLQYVSNRRLARVEMIAHQTTLTRYLDAVAADVRRVYEDAAQEMLAVPGDALAAQRFDAVAQHFDDMDASAARLLFAGSLDGCLCETRYYDPETGQVAIGADPATEAIIMRVTARLRLEWIQHLNRSDIYVDELSGEHRVVYRFITDSGSATVGFAGFVVDERRFESEYLPQAIASMSGLLDEDVRDNLIVRVTDRAGRVLAATHDQPGQDDPLTGRFDFVFEDLELSARSRHTAAAQVLRSNALTSWILSALMSLVAVAGVLLTWRAARRERQLSRIRSGFVANVSHELRTPLASIAVFGELLRRGRITAREKVVECGSRIEQESARLRHLIDNVLSFRRIESAEVHYRPRPAVLEDVVRAAVAAVDSRRAQEGFTIVVTAPEGRLPAVSVDEAAMTQVFVNLLDNAMKYSGSCRRVRVGLRRCGGDLAVDVADEGIGIAPEDRTRIFDEFYRAVSRSSGVAGTGLGLAIVRHVVRAHGGRIRVDSRPGRGTTFTVLLSPAAAEVRRGVDVQSVIDRAGIGIESRESAS